MYTLEDYKRIQKESTFVLPQDTLDIITNLAKLVGVEVICKPKPEKKQSVTNQITVLLNKLTTENATEIQDKIISLVNAEPTVEISSVIFDIASANSFYSTVYANLYVALIKKWPAFNDLFQLKLNDHITNLTHIQVLDSSNYDEFCSCNAKNDKYKSFSLFVVNLTIKGVVDYAKFSNVIDQLLDMIHTSAPNIISEIAEHLYILIVKSKPIHKLLSINHTKLKNTNGLPNKVVFRLMDILDAI